MNRLATLLAVLPALLWSAHASAASVTLDAAVDGDIRHFGGTVVDTVADRLTTFSSGGNQRFGVIEFDLGAIPDNVIIDSASLRLTTFGGLTNVPNTPTVTLRVFGYADAFADGAITADDKPSNGAVHGSLVATAVYNKTNNGGPPANTVLSIGLDDVSGVATAVAGVTSDFFGVVFETDDFATIRFHSLENIGQLVPALTVNYTVVPLPPALPLLGVGLAWLMARRRAA